MEKLQDAQSSEEITGIHFFEPINDRVKRGFPYYYRFSARSANFNGRRIGIILVQRTRRIALYGMMHFLKGDETRSTGWNSPLRVPRGRIRFKLSPFCANLT